MALPNEKFLNKIAVDKVIKPILDEQLIWDSKLKHQSIDGLVALYYKEQYVQIETPNDVAQSRTIDPKLRAPQVRGEFGLFPYMDVSGPKEYSLRLNQIALATKWSEEEMKYATMENRVLKKQEGLANAYAGSINTQLSNALTESWSTSPTSIQQVDIGSSTSWADAVSAADPPADILEAIEKIEDIAGYNYKASTLMLSKEGYYDLLNWMVQKNFAYSFKGPEGPQAVMNMLGLDILKTNMVKRGFGIVADFAACGVMYVAEGTQTRIFKKDEDHTFHMQMYGTQAFAVTDPKAIVTLKNMNA